MSYTFKNMADVELLGAMPENANVFVEVDGSTRRAPQVKVDVTGELAVTEALEEVPDGATVLAEVNGEIKRVPGSGLGGGKALIIKGSDFDNTVAGLQTTSAAIEVTYTANMTFEEMMEAFIACELIGGFMYIVANEAPARAPVVTMMYDVNTYTVPCMILMVISDSGQIFLYWTADGISTTEPESAVAPS